MGGTKRKIEIAKIEEEEARAVTFSKRRHGLYSKASDLLFLSPNSQIAILATPVSSNSHVSFYSFGHSSVDSVVSAFLNNERPPPPPPPETNNFWFQDESLTKSEDPHELKSYIDSISTMLQDLKALRAQKRAEEDLKRNKLALHGTHLEEETLNLHSNLEGSSNHGEEHLLAIPDNNNINHELLGDLDGCHEEEFFSLDELYGLVTESQGTSMNLEMDDQNPCSGSGEDGELVMLHGDLKNNELALHGTHLEEDTLNLQSSLGVQNLEGFSNHSEAEEPILAISDNNNELLGNLDEFSLDQIFDIVTESEGISVDISLLTNQNASSGSEEDEALVVIQGDNLEEVQTVTISENDNNIIISDIPAGNLDGYNQELELDPFTDFETEPNALLEDVSMVMTTNQNMCFEYSGGAEDGGSVVSHRDLDPDNLLFAHFFNELTPIAAL